MVRIPPNPRGPNKRRVKDITVPKLSNDIRKPYISPAFIWEEGLCEICGKILDPWTFIQVGARHYCSGQCYEAYHPGEEYCGNSHATPEYRKKMEEIVANRKAGNIKSKGKSEYITYYPYSSSDKIINRKFRSLKDYDFSTISEEEENYSNGELITGIVGSGLIILLSIIVLKIVGLFIIAPVSLLILWALIDKNRNERLKSVS